MDFNFVGNSGISVSAGDVVREIMKCWQNPISFIGRPIASIYFIGRPEGQLHGGGALHGGNQYTR